MIVYVTYCPWSQVAGMQAWYYCLSKHRGLGSGSVTTSCLPALWVVISLLHMTKCKENNERIRVRELAAKHRKTHAPPIIRGSIVCMSHINVFPPECPVYGSDSLYLLHLPCITYLWSIHGSVFVVLHSNCAMSDGNEWSSSESNFITSLYVQSRNWTNGMAPAT